VFEFDYVRSTTRNCGGTNSTYFALKQWLQNDRNFTAAWTITLAFLITALDKPPHTTARESVGERWRFAALSAGDVEEAFAGRPFRF